MSRESIGATLKKTRKTRNMTQEDVAMKISCDRAIISKIESGKYRGGLLLLERYINLMEFEISITPLTKSRPTFDELSNLYD